MTERIAYNEYAKLKDNTIITMKICPSVQDSTKPRRWYISLYNMRAIKLHVHCTKCVVLLISSLLCRLRLNAYVETVSLGTIPYKTCPELITDQYFIK